MVEPNSETNTLDTADTYTVELVEYIKELHTKLTSKEDQIESLKEDVRHAELWAKAKKPKLQVTICIPYSNTCISLYFTGNCTFLRPRNRDGNQQS